LIVTTNDVKAFSDANFGLGLGVLALTSKFNIMQLRNSMRLNYFEMKEHRRSILLLLSCLFYIYLLVGVRVKKKNRRDFYLI